MMADLQEIYRRQQVAGHQEGLDRRLGIPAEQRREAAMAEQEHDRSVIDVAIGKRCFGIRLGWIEDLDRRGRVERDDVTGSGNRHRDGRVLRVGQQALIGWILVGDSGVDHGADAEALEHLHQSGDVVLMRVTQHEQIDASREEGQVGAQPPQGELRVRTAVHQHGRATRSFDEDGVALPDVQHRNVQPAVGA